MSKGELTAFLGVILGFLSFVLIISESEKRTEQARLECIKTKSALECKVLFN